MPNHFIKTALFISPHLDDVAFSCGGTLAKLSDENWRTILCTIFTKSVRQPKGFALQCQTDKGLSPEIDYMKLRRTEDCRAAKILNAGEVLHLNFTEAPHRGYESAPELFAGVKTEDEIWRPVAEHLALLGEIHQPELVFAPQGLGSHADHLQTIRAVGETFPAEKTVWYRDAPYAIRQPNAPHSVCLPPNLRKIFYDINLYLEKKVEACAAYESQINFQFGGGEKLKTILEGFHRQEAQDYQVESAAVEAFLATDFSP